MTLSQSALALRLNRSGKWVAQQGETFKDGRETWKRVVTGTPGRPHIYELQDGTVGQN